MILIFYLFVAYSILHIEKIINNVIIKKGGNMFGRWKYLILAVFAFITIACGIMIPFVNINYDNSKYLPADNKIKEGLDLLESEFGSSGYLLVMVEGVANAERINELKELLSVDDVNHVDYRVKDDKVLMQVVLAESDYSARTQEAIGDIVKRLDEAGYNYYMSGQSYLTYYFNQMVKKQLPRILLIIIPIVFLILTLMTTSFIEPALFAVVTGVAIVLGMGTNIIFPEISYLTYAVSPVLQLALCMDYSIIMFSRYRHYRKQNLSRNEALTKAWKTSLVPVLASSLTTVAGFVAIMFMKYRIGADVGLVLAKAILFSLITVIFMLPALIILFDKLIEKTSHRSFFSLLKKDRGGLKAGYNKYIFRSRFVVPALALVIIGVAFFLQLNTKYIYSDTAPTYDLKEIKESRDNIKDNFGLSNQAVILIKRDRDIAPLLTGLEELRYEGENYITSVFAYTKQYTKEELKHYLKDYEIDDATLNLLFNYVNGSAPAKTTVSFEEIAALIDIAPGFETELSAGEMASALSGFIDAEAEDLSAAYEIMGVERTSVVALVGFFAGSYTLSESVSLIGDLVSPEELAAVYQDMGATELTLAEITGYYNSLFASDYNKNEMFFILKGMASADELARIYAFAEKDAMTVKELIFVFTAPYDEGTMKMLLPEVAGEKISAAFGALAAAGKLSGDGKITLGEFAGFLIENYAAGLTEEEISLLRGKTEKLSEMAGFVEKIATIERIYPLASSASAFDLSLLNQISAIDREAITSQFMSEGYQRVILTVDLEDESETSFGFFTELENLLEEEEGEYYLISSTATIMAIKESSSRDHIVTLAISVGLIFLIIALSFKSIFVPLLLIVVIQGAIFINMAIANVAGTRIIFLGYLIVNCIQLGATIDYGILYTDRYLSHRGKSSRAESVANATSEALPTIMTSGLILFCAGMVLSAVSGIPVVALMGRLIGVGGLISVAMILFVLPQTLLLADRVLLKKGAN